MKFLMEEHDEINISKIREDIQQHTQGQRLPLFVSKGEEYFIKFRVTDIAKANVFVANLMRLSDQNKDTIGVEVESLHFSSDLDSVQKEHIKSELTRLVHEIDQM